MIYVANTPLGQNVRNLRRKKGIPLEMLAERTGIPHPVLCGLENGELQDIKHRHLINLCSVLGATREEMLTKDCIK